MYVEIFVSQGVTVYKQEEYAFIGKLQNGCDAEASGECFSQFDTAFYNNYYSYNM